ncbi:EamA family transporter [Catenulispora sp. NL8]|uniref:EamA family transporter n=1 Tax=Catenulispora pinistramenti TaxID=2705254 RepID=A0ABS5KMQ8_9ACTN|nr:EamA family transporter [Catenulispora pinistramenti]MBS2547301.1 EamA family transporter [Catenulispora pinistramenti]
MIYLVFSGVLWGTGGLTGRLLSLHTHLSPTAVAGYRLLTGGLFLVLFATATGHGRRPRGRAAWIRIGVVGALSAGFQACYFAAVALTDVSLATLLTIGAAPVLVIGFEQATGRRHLDTRVAATVSLAVLGLGLLVGEPPHGITMAHILIGAAFAVTSAAGFSAISLIGKSPVPGLDEVTMTGYSFTLGGLALVAAATLTTGVGFAPTPEALSLLAALGLVPTAIAYACYFIGLRDTAASTGTVTALLEPLTGTVLAIALLGDRLTAIGIAGAALLAVSVTAEAWQNRPRVSG